jgi:hypothetical protein
MQKPPDEIIDRMKESVRTMSNFLADVDFDALTAAEAVQLYRLLDATENVVSAGIKLVTPVIDRAASRR